MQAGSDDRLLPANREERGLARALYSGIADLPVVAVHGHVPAEVLADDLPFPDPASLLVTSDHYVLRALHSVGVPLDHLGRGPTPAPPERVWDALCGHWPALVGTATGLWLEHELRHVFAVACPPAPGDFAVLAARLAEPGFRPRALYRRFGIEVLSTTDDAGADHSPHLTLQAQGLRVVPTLRPDDLTDATTGRWAPAVAATGVTTLQGLGELLRSERLRSAAAGALATDHGHATCHTEDLAPGVAASLFDRVMQGRADSDDRARLAGHLLCSMAVMALDDGLALQLHTGVLRDHDRPSVARYGPDTGSDFPVPVSFTAGLRALLERCGNEAALRMVVFTLDESTWSRELAPLASYWPALHLGAPWWFLDGPGAIGRQLDAVSEIAGYSKLSGFVDDTRAFCSIPARHDVARRAVSAHLAGAVACGRMGMGDANRIARDYAYDAPRRLYRTA